MSTWVFPTVSEAFMSSEPALDWRPAHPGWEASQGEREWHCVIATILALLPLSQAQFSLSYPGIDRLQGMILTGPTPLLSDQGLLANFYNWIFTPTQVSALQLPPCEPSLSVERGDHPMQSIPLLPADPLTAERFFLVQTQSFSWLAVLRWLPGQGSQCQFSFVPETIEQVLQLLRSRIQLTQPHQVHLFDQLLQRWPPLTPDYRFPLQFSRQLLQTYRQEPSPTLPLLSHPPLQPSRQRNPQLPLPSPLPQNNPTPPPPQPTPSASWKKGDDIALLQALAHEVRTPLTTIQTFTQLLLKRSDLPAEVLKRLESIRRECHDQIDRFSLIFRAMELANTEATPTHKQLTSISVQQVLEANIPRWRKQADRRNLSLEITVPQELPAIAISDPNMLEQVLTGLMERLSHSLPMGSQIHLQIVLAGDQLKLELCSNQSATHPEQLPAPARPMLQAIGDLLMLQPETGGVSLSLPMTKHLFEILGGKLTVRQHQQQGEVLTIFLPLGTDRAAY
ncbi:MAG: HAMP domain-containing histidine kinase [Acaryochloris sp. RU_4_1]|nr:HAMP domain-containing histidine kinase [Acaryochloris sp. SU_5_25]NJM64633.1 HAMP domain-containing histidine kinase [Acaryochloris sp. RU_4_1]NJR53556.1 HAMP domain-containing histidine kinase [Acaryochloris sp. CRU_2_0]